MKTIYRGTNTFSKKLKVVLAIALFLLGSYLILSYLPSKSKEIKGALKNRDHEKSKTVENQEKGEVGNENEFDIENYLGNVKGIPEKVFERLSCPACFGEELCEDIERGILKLDESNQEPTDGIYLGKYGGKSVLIKHSSNEKKAFDKFDSFICKNVTQHIHCDVSKAIVNENSFVIQEDTFLSSNMQKIWRIAYDSPEYLPSMICATNGFIQDLGLTFDSNEDDTLNTAEVAQLFTTAVLSPESTVLKMLSGFKMEMPFPKYYGSCGRAIVLEHEGTTLESHLSDPWPQRAEYSLQILEFIDVFINGHSEWFIMYGDFKMDNFAVTEEGKVFIIDAKDVGIIDKNLVPEDHEDADTTACNEECFTHYAHGLFESDSKYHQHYCEQAPHIVGLAMYSVACKHLLSDLPIHTEEIGSKASGLLHSIPHGHEQLISQLLEECVTETTPGGRLNAVEELKDVLEEYASA